MIKLFRILLYCFLGFIILSISVSFFTLSFVSKKLGQPSNYLFNTLRSASSSNPYSNQDKINFVILGLDKRDDTLEKTITTDTVIFASLNLKNFKLNIVSIPRDLWFYDINAKVNEIYPLSQKESDKYAFIKTKFQKLTNQNIDHVVVLTTDNLIKFVNLIGGVDLVLDTGFKDTQYPNPEYIKNPSKNIPIYKTVEFKAGPIHLDESNITEFVRSRHGGETAAQGGTDLGRIHRQQLLLEAVLAKVKSGQFISSESQLIDFYKFWNQDIEKDINDVQALQITSLLSENINKIELNKSEITVGTNAKNGLIYHPTTFINKQWVFIPSDKEYKALQDFIQNSIN
jgi:LCP family protein required for cell wall assembly